MITTSFPHCLSTDCKTEDEQFEEGEIFQEDDIEKFESTGQNTELLVSNENHFVENVKEKCSKPLLEERPHQMSHQQMVQDSIHFSRFDNSRPRQNWIPRNKRTITKQDFGNQMDNDKPWRKKSKFDHSDKKQPIIRNYQNGLYNKRKNYDIPMEPAEASNDEEISNVRGTNSPNVSNFESFPQELENKEELYSLKKFRGRGREIHGVNKERISKDTDTKQWMITGLCKENKQYDIEKKICKYFLSGICSKYDNCTYIHQKPKDRKMKPCKFYLKNNCTRENQCPYMHSDFPCKYYHTGNKCYSGKYCRFSHAKIDNDKKYIFQKLFGKLCDNPEYIENKFKEKKTHFLVPKNDEIKMPYPLEMQIPVRPKFKSTEKNSDKYLESNHDKKSRTPMPQPPSQDAPIFDNTLKYQKYINNDKNRTGKQKFSKEQREERQKELKIEKNRQCIDDMCRQTNVYPSFDGIYDKNEVNELVIDEEKFQNDDSYEFKLLPKKQKQLYNQIQSHQKNNNEIDMSDDYFSSEEHYSSDISEHLVFNSINNSLNILQNEEKELSPTCSLSKSNSSKLEQVNIYEANSDYLAKLPSIKSSVNKSTIGIQPSPLKMAYDFEETIQDEISNIEEYSTSSMYNYGCAIELGKSDKDLKQLTYKFPITTATEIEASIDSHPPIKYHILPVEVPVRDYSKILFMIGIDDPRHRYGIKAARNLKFIQNVPATVSAVTVRPEVTPKKMFNRDPRKRPQDVLLKSAIQAPLLQTPYSFQPYPMDIDMRYIPPQMIAMMPMINDPSRGTDGFWRA